MKRIFKSIILFGAFLVFTPALYAQVSIGLSVRIAPPALPVYTQPACPADGYIWTPGYWAYGDNGYYWVPGVWVRPPRVGVLWTPGYWGFDGGGMYVFHAGYWGPHVGFYGGINYGFGYSGIGFGGGLWAGNVFRYNTAVTNVNRTVIRNTYVNNTVINNTTVNNRASFNGRGGIDARPSREEQRVMNENNHIQATSQQISHQDRARQDRGQLASANNGRPANMAMNRIGSRRSDQQGRIANGVSSGQLNAGETRKLEGREANLNKEVRKDRINNGGALTGQEQQRINRQQNRMNNAINADKHNANMNRRMPNMERHPQGGGRPPREERGHEGHQRG